MKRSFPPSTTPRASSGYLPVPIFNQKKRIRQPLTSAPQRNEPSSSCFHQAPDSYDFSPVSTENVILQPVNPGQKIDTSLQVFQQLQHPLAHQQYKFNTTGYSKGSTGKNQTSWTQEDFVHQNSRTKNQVYKHTTKQSKDPLFADMPEDEMVQAVPLHQMTVKEKENSLRILPATIESMKHWSEYTDKIPLLFELLATLDSAVTSGDHGSKLFLMRDGKSCVPCIFYEIDRELPRLIRGRVHRSVGNYDKKRNILKCVSVRPASGTELQTFKEFINAANEEMEKYTKTFNEM
ncbi:spermatogenesis-associated protein 22 [Pelobates fuscus]|uniref:spermatogenesis-associated protein 22 n=1 Tax=Pelobates fuscus TaxID=191477 RepID=UPI002FE49ECA